ncbi:MAG: hypothetical protein K0R08_642 [Solimicrobium sp.]|jgi:hypothetical protein|nr:hypothetical protein [Solimicrobium sp.]
MLSVYKYPPPPAFLNTPNEHEENKNEIDQVGSYSSQAARAYANAWVRDRFHLHQLLDISEAGSQALCDVNIQKFLELEENQQYLGQVIGFSSGARWNLANPWIQARIAEGRILFKQIMNVRFGNFALCDPDVQDFFEQPEYLQHVDKVLGFSEFAAGALEDVWVRSLIADKKLSFEELAGISESESDDLRDPTIQREVDLNLRKIADIIGQ